LAVRQLRWHDLPAACLPVGRAGRRQAGNFCPPSLSDSDFSAAEFRASETGAPHYLNSITHIRSKKV